MIVVVAALVCLVASAESRVVGAFVMPHGLVLSHSGVSFLRLFCTCVVQVE